MRCTRGRRPGPRWFAWSMRRLDDRHTKRVDGLIGASSRHRAGSCVRPSFHRYRLGLQPIWGPNMRFVTSLSMAILLMLLAVPAFGAVHLDRLVVPKGFHVAV